MAMFTGKMQCTLSRLSVDRQHTQSSTNVVQEQNNPFDELTIYVSLATGNEIMMFLAAWSTEKIILGSLLLKLVCWTRIKKDKALVSCFYSPEPAVGIFLSKTFPKRKTAPQTKSRECKSLTPIAIRHLGKLMQRKGRSSYDRLKWVTSVSWSHWWNVETTLIFRNDTVISNAYLMISVQLSCRNGVVTTWFTSLRSR